MKILDYALALDGGTQIIELECDDGTTISVGLDGRMDSPAAGRQLFVGNGPDSADTQWLEIGSSAEQEVIAFLEQWLDETQGFIRRESLMDANHSDLKGQNLLDRLALDFLLEVRNRDLR
jgi:hypothetical protein